MAKIGTEAGQEGVLQLMQLPLLLTTIGIACSLLGILIVRLMAGKHPAEALRFGTIGSAVLFIGAAFGLASLLGLSKAVGLCVLRGAVGGTIIGLTTEHLTGGKPVREFARQGETAAASRLI